jgi:hypothetical protein
MDAEYKEINIWRSLSEQETEYFAHAAKLISFFENEIKQQGNVDPNSYMPKIHAAIYDCYATTRPMLDEFIAMCEELSSQKSRVDLAARNCRLLLFRPSEKHAHLLRVQRDLLLMELAQVPDEYLKQRSSMYYVLIQTIAGIDKPELFLPQKSAKSSQDPDSNNGGMLKTLSTAAIAGLAGWYIGAKK